MKAPVDHPLQTLPRPAPVGGGNGGGSRRRNAVVIDAVDQMSQRLTLIGQDRLMVWFVGLGDDVVVVRGGVWVAVFFSGFRCFGGAWSDVALSGLR